MRSDPIPIHRSMSSIDIRNIRLSIFPVFQNTHSPASRVASISLPVDSLVFASLAFLILPPLFGSDALPWAALPPIIGGQILWKAIVTVVSLPMIYLVKEQPLRLALVEDPQTQAKEE